jgi:hypothetical protein
MPHTPICERFVETIDVGVAVNLCAVNEFRLSDPWDAEKYAQWAELPVPCPSKHQ